MEWLGISVLHCVGTCTILPRYGQWTKEGFQAARYPIEMAASHILGYGILGAPERGDRVRERQVSSIKPSTVVTTGEEFDRVMARALPELLDCATAHIRRFLRETGRWADDISHEKLAIRWGYEQVERFLVCGRAEIPCRPFFLLESFIAKFLSQPEPLCYQKDLLTPLGRFLDGLTARAVLSRDALVALFYHLYGVAEIRQETQGRPFMFWVSFQDGTPEESIDSRIREIHGRTGQINAGWYKVEVSLPQPQTADSFVESLKKATIVKAVKTSLNTSPDQ